MCLITMSTLGTALGMSAAAISSATAASAAGVSALGVATGIANAALAIGAIAGIGSAGMGAVNSYQQGKAQKAQSEYESQVAQQNAKIAQQNAAMERQQGIEEARLQRIKAAQVIGSQKTAMAANGVDVTQGTALDVIEDTAAMGELDALQTRYNYERKAQAYEMQGYNFQNQSNLDILAGENAYSAGKLNGLAAGLEGITKVGDVASKWFDFGGDTQNTQQQGLKINSGMKNKWAIAGLSM